MWRYHSWLVMWTSNPRTRVRISVATNIYNVIYIMEDVLRFYRYRLETWEYASELQLLIYDVIKETPKWYWIWIKTGFDVYDKHFILKCAAKKKYARDTEMGALFCYEYRTRKRIAILQQQLRNSEIWLKKAQDLLGNWH